MNPFRTHSATLALLAAAALAGCSADKAQSAAPVAVPVVIATVEQRTVPVEVRAIGNVEALSTVGIKSQITAELVGVHFTEGQDVAKGQLLFTFDRRPIEAELKRAEGTLAKDLAQLKNAEVQAARYAKLVEEGVVAREQYDQIQSNAEALRAAVEADRAQVDFQKVQLTYTSIHASVSGRTGDLKVHQGNIVKANADDPMLTINQVEPINVAFSVPQQELPDVKRYMQSGQLKVDAVLPNGDRAAAGKLTFVDNAVDLATGTIKLKGTFPNQDRRLWPGQFVNVVLTLHEQPDAITVPAQAVQTGQQGQFVFVVKPDLTAESRPVTVGRNINGLVVIEKGLQSGEKVVTDGQLRLVPGAKVEPKNPVEAAQS